MNQKNIEILFQNYLKHFDMLNDRKNDEKYKWKAVKHVQDNWNLKAENLAEMIREAFSDCDNLIDNRFIHPTTGMIELAKVEPEAVNDAFFDLLQDDNGDLQFRQSRIWTFVDSCNALLQKHFPGSWKYVQNVTAAINYLAMIKPTQNYLYKYTPADNFAKYMEYGDGIGRGRDFHLSSYYRMCDELIEHVRKCPEIIKRDQERACITKAGDESLHVLAYDLIYCFDEYKLNEGMKVPAEKKKSPQAKQQSYHREQAMRIKAELNEMQDEIDVLTARLEKLPEHNFVGEVLNTSRFGIVQIKKQEERRLYFEDAGGTEKRFSLPRSVASGMLKHPDSNVVSRYKEECEISKKISDMDKEQRAKYIELGRYED